MILGLLGMYFDAVEVEVKTFLLLFRLALALLCTVIASLGLSYFIVYIKMLAEISFGSNFRNNFTHTKSYKCQSSISVW